MYRPSLDAFRGRGMLISTGRQTGGMVCFLGGHSVPGMAYGEPDQAPTPVELLCGRPRRASNVRGQPT